jgi:hypothetical protein
LDFSRAVRREPARLGGIGIFFSFLFFLSLLVDLTAIRSEFRQGISYDG